MTDPKETVAAKSGNSYSTNAKLRYFFEQAWQLAVALLIVFAIRSVP